MTMKLKNLFWHFIVDLRKKLIHLYPIKKCSWEMEKRKSGEVLINIKENRSGLLSVMKVNVDG